MAAGVYDIRRPGARACFASAVTVNNELKTDGAATQEPLQTHTAITKTHRPSFPRPSVPSHVTLTSRGALNCITVMISGAETA